MSICAISYWQLTRWKNRELTAQSCPSSPLLICVPVIITVWPSLLRVQTLPFFHPLPQKVVMYRKMGSQVTWRGSGGATLRFGWARESRISPQKFLDFSPKKVAKNSQHLHGVIRGLHSLSILVSLRALKTVDPCTQSYVSLSEELIPCENSTKKRLPAAMHYVSSHWNYLCEGLY